MSGVDGPGRGPATGATDAARPDPADLDARRRALAERHAPWAPMTLDERLERCADEFADRPLVVCDATTLSYAEVHERAVRYGDGLAALGVRPGDRVAILMANFPELVPLKFAVARAGAIAVPLNFRYLRDELAWVLRRCGASVLVTMTAFDGLDLPATLDELVPGWAAPGPAGAARTGAGRTGPGETARGSAARDDASADRRADEGLPDLRRVVVLPTDAPARAGATTVADLGAAGDAAPGAVGAARARPDDVGDLVFTSGTTGSPKGVLLTHDAVQRTAMGTAGSRAFGDGRRVLVSLPCYHLFGYVEGLLAAMMVGGAVVLRTGFDAAHDLRAIEEHAVTDVLAVPTMVVALLEHPDCHVRDLSTLTAALISGAAAPTWLWQRVRDELGVPELTTGYGMTETGGGTVMTLPEDPVAVHAGTVGRTKLAGPAGLAGGGLSEYRAADPETGELLPPGTEGELVCRGPTMMRGFWDDPERTAEALRDGWVLSGDLGRVREDGYVEVTGRSKELYKSGGELVMPREIEELLATHPGVSQAFAVGLPDERWGEVGCVWIVPAADRHVDADEVLALCRSRLARFKVPRHVLFAWADELPLTPTGKVQKFRLVERARAALAAAPA